MGRVNFVHATKFLTRRTFALTTIFIFILLTPISVNSLDCVHYAFTRKTSWIYIIYIFSFVASRKHLLCSFFENSLQELWLHWKKFDIKIQTFLRIWINENSCWFNSKTEFNSIFELNQLELLFIQLKNALNVDSNL